MTVEHKLGDEVVLRRHLRLKYPVKQSKIPFRTFIDLLYASSVALIVGISLIVLPLDIDFSRKEILDFRAGAVDAGIYLILFLFGSFLVFVTGIIMFGIAVWSLKTKAKSDLPPYAGRIMKEIRKSDEDAFDQYFYKEKIRTRGLRRSEWNVVVLKKSKLYWNPTKLFETFRGKRWAISLTLIFEIWFVVGILALLISIIPMTDAMGEDATSGFVPITIEFLIISFVLATYVGIGDIIDALEWLWTAWKRSLEYYDLIGDYQKAVNNYYNSMAAKAAASNAADDLAHFIVAQNLQREICDVPRHPYGPFLSMFILVPSLIAILSWVARTFL